jgi:chromosome segregation ATPase
MRKVLSLGMALVLTLIFVVSCSSGISQEQYQQATNDLAAAQIQIQSLQSDKDALISSQQKAAEDMAAVKAQIQSLENDKAAMAILQQKIDKARPYWVIFQGFFQIGISGQAATTAQITDIISKVQATGDATLTAKLQAVFNNGGTQENIDLVNCLMAKIGEALN